jgi:hypothetical protein
VTATVLARWRDLRNFIARAVRNFLAYGEILPIWIAILAWLARCPRLAFDTFGAAAMAFRALSAQAPTKFP